LPHHRVEEIAFLREELGPTVAVSIGDITRNETPVRQGI
jgi:hypothetical protein